MCLNCQAGSLYTCYDQYQRNAQKEFKFQGLRNMFNGTEKPMSIEDATYILMEVGCNNLLGIYHSIEEARKEAIKIARKRIVKLHIFFIADTIESSHKVEVSSEG